MTGLCEGKPFHASRQDEAIASILQEAHVRPIGRFCIIKNETLKLKKKKEEKETERVLDIRHDYLSQPMKILAVWWGLTPGLFKQWNWGNLSTATLIFVVPCRIREAEFTIQSVWNYSKKTSSLQAEICFIPHIVLVQSKQLGTANRSIILKNTTLKGKYFLSDLCNDLHEELFDILSANQHQGI